MDKNTLLSNLFERQKGYDYSLVPEEFTYNEKLPIICHEKDALGNEHGIFRVSYGKMTRGDRCPKCSGKYMTKDLFVAEARLVHGDSYIYDKFEFVNKKTKGTIYCPKHDIYFEQTPCKHLYGQGCPKCRYEKASKSKTHTQEWFLQKAKEIHGDKYDYSKSVYVKNHENLTIVCHEKDRYGFEHGEFLMTPNNHLHKSNPQGCPKCGREKSIKSRTIPFEKYVSLASTVHNGKYIYDPSSYANTYSFIDITCPIHGVFNQKASNHLWMCQGCPKCANQMSNAEGEIVEYLKSLNPNIVIEQRNRNIIKPFELDIFLPQQNIAIEFNGLVWHGEKFNHDKYSHLYKTKKCAENGIRLIHIFEDEWLCKKDIVKSRIKSILGGITDKIYARKCMIQYVDSRSAMKFLDDNHIQGRCKGKYHIGLYHDGELVSMMSFGCTRQQKKYNEDYENTYELLRFCNKLNITVIGGASKLLKYFIKNIKPSQIISYADKRWSNGNLYFQLGFKHIRDSVPNYFYIVGKHRENRFKYRKSELIKQGFDPSKSEHEIMLERKIYRIYDCGTMVFVKNINSN